MRILLVDDETQLTTPLSHILSNDGYDVDVAADGEQGLKLANSEHYDLLILDWMLPHCSGLEICRNLRLAGKTTPVLFLTAKDTLDDRVEGLDAGADDYLVKPFELRELQARVRALLRRSNAFIHLKVADLELDSENQIVYRQGKAIALSEKEIALLTLFMQHPGQLLTHEIIYQYVWTDSSGETPNSNVLAALVRLLRRKIEIEKGQPIIHTVYSKGYRFGDID